MMTALDFFMKTVGYFDINDKTIRSYLVFLIKNMFLIRKDIAHVKLLPWSRPGWDGD